MKTMTAIVVVALGCAFANGCKDTSIQVIHTDNVVTNTVQLKGFNDENYVWESWKTSTNRIDITN